MIVYLDLLTIYYIPMSLPVEETNQVIVLLVETNRWRLPL